MDAGLKKMVMQRVTPANNTILRLNQLENQQQLASQYTLTVNKPYSLVTSCFLCFFVFFTLLAYIRGGRLDQPNGNLGQVTIC